MKRELVAFLLLYSVDGRCHVSVGVHCLFLTVPWSIVRDCCISWLNSHTFSYMIRQSCMRYMFFPRTHLFEKKKQSTQCLEF